MTMKNLEKHIDEYLLWMIDQGYGERTVLVYKSGLERFKQFAKDKNHVFAFSYETYMAFKENMGRSPATALKGFSNYLFNQGIIPHPIVKPVPLLPDIFERYLDFYSNVKGVSFIVSQRTRRVLKAFNDDLDVIGIRLNVLKIEHVDTFLSKYNRGYAKETKSKHYSIIRGFLKYLYQNGIIKRDLANLLIGPTVFAQNKPPKFLRPNEIQHLFNSLNNTTPKNIRRAAMVHIGFSLGLRPKEISQVSLDDIMFEKREICIPDRKNTTPARLPLPETTIQVIAAYILEERPKTDSRRLFINDSFPYNSVKPGTVVREITSAMKTAGLPSSSYWLRHTYAQNLLEANMSIFEIKEMMGHDSLQTIMYFNCIPATS